MSARMAPKRGCAGMKLRKARLLRPRRTTTRLDGESLAGSNAKVYDVRSSKTSPKRIASNTTTVSPARKIARRMLRRRVLLSSLDRSLAR